MNLDQAKKYADKIVQWLRPHCVRIEVAGSIRRERPEVNDIDIVCIPKQTIYVDMFQVETGRQNHLWMFLMNYVNNHPSRGKVSKPGEESVRLIAGDQPDCKQMIVQLPKVQLDLWFADETNFASRLLMRTGSKEHNIWFAERAQSRGLKWAPYSGLRRDRGGNPNGPFNPETLPAATEADLYTALGLELIDPVNRERDWIHKNLEFGL